MGIDYSSKLLLVPDNHNTYSILEEYSEKEFAGDFFSAIDELGLASASPWYDSSPSDWDIGVELPHPTYEDLLDQESCWWDSLNNAKMLLDKIFGEGDHKLSAYHHIY